MSYGSIKLNDGNLIPSIAYGAGSVWKSEDVTQYVTQALEQGFDHLDNAQYYANEEYVGAALAASGLARKDIFITSKYSGGGEIDAALAASLEKLRVDYLDLYLIHNPRTIPPGQLAATWAKFEGFRAAGKAKSIGVSNFGVAELTELLASAKVVPAVNQIQLHPYNYAQQLPTLRLCAKRGITVEAYSSLAPITKAPGGPLDPVLARIAKRIGGTPAQAIFAWLRQKGIVIVTTSGKAERLREYLDVPALPPLTDDEVAQIEAAGAEGARGEKYSVPGKEVDLEAQTPLVLAPRTSRWPLVGLGLCGVVYAGWQLCMPRL